MNVLEQIESLLAEASPPWQLVDVHTNLQKRVDIQLHCLLRTHAADLLTVAKWLSGETTLIGHLRRDPEVSLEAREALARLEAEVE